MRIGINMAFIPKYASGIYVMCLCVQVMTFSGQSQQTGTQRFSYEVQAVLGRLYGAENVTYATILPHFHFPDFVLGFTTRYKVLTVVSHSTRTPGRDSPERDPCLVRFG